MSARPRPSEYEKENKNPLLLIPGVKIGKEGLEKTLEQTLRGQPGGQRVEVTARGKLVKELDPKPDRSGGTVQLTIDADLHEYAARRIGDQSGSVVVIDVTNGDILAMPSMPSFDPNNFSDGISDNEWKMLSQDDHLPLVDKVLESLYPSGSTIKPLMALALLKAGDRPQAARRSARAPIRVGNHVFHCDKRHGPVDMDDAVVQSCDIYFYEMCRRVGAEAHRADGRADGLRREIRPAVRLPALRHRARPRVDAAQISPRVADLRHDQHVDRPGQCADQSAAAGGDGEPHCDGRRVAAAPAQGQRQPRRRAARGSTPTISISSARRWAAWSTTAPPPRAKLPLDNVKMAGKTGTAQVRRITMAERDRRRPLE